MGICASSKLLFGIIKRPLYVVNSKAEKKNVIESDQKKKKSACKARVLFQPVCVHSLYLLRVERGRVARMRE